MAETFLFNIAQIVLGKIGTLAYGEASLVWGVHHDLQRLERTLSNVRAVLLDAEEKQVHNHALRVWLGQLKDVFSKAEDVLDEFECEALRKQVVKTCGSTSRKVRRFFSSSNSLAFRIRMAHKIKEIREKLDEIAADKIKFHCLVENVVDRRIVHKREMTHSFVNTSDVIGRDVDKEKIIEHLLMHPGDGEHCRSVSVVPIVGIGGLGKTTLAKLVFNDERVAQHFQMRLWVCVSNDFDLKILMTKIIKSAFHENVNDLDPDQLQTRLRATLNDQKFLLVLDDVWNEDRSKWIELTDLLRGGAHGSKIMVTTRSNSIAAMVETVPTYKLEGLPQQDCLALFVKWAFKERLERKYPNLMEIATEIVRKCGGVPLAVRTLGSLLFSKTDERDWIFVRDNEIWKLKQKEDDILPALKLSYDQMPSYLKQCFACCAIFPKDYEFESIELIHIWMAHDLLRSPDENQELEDIGMQYINELCSRSFFQDFEDYGQIYVFKLHDLAHDLALFVAKGECLTIQPGAQNIAGAQRARHLSFLTSESDFPDQALFPNFENLRTIYFPIEGLGPYNESLLRRCVLNFKCLRVLDLSDSTFDVLPQTIGKMKHLRILDISRNLKIKRLPDSICKLQNLQVLSVNNCVELEELPRDMGNLISLRLLHLTTKQSFLRETGIGSLRSLRVLVVTQCNNLASLFELQLLTNLRSLKIESCENLKSLPHGIMNLTALQHLIISNCKKFDMSVEGEENQYLGLNLQILRLEKLPKLAALPPWLQSATTLQTIQIEGCTNFAALPEWFINLRSLQKLSISRCPKLLSLPDGMDHLTSLEELRIVSCPGLYPETGADLSKIAHIPCVKVLYADY
ncbi:Disease resistance protein [Quillaja saponaria]|uniref:Disease resistance protein n=1 Tax=Quillaja saponaria TaxID=32244 RepID=A0AAD7Q8J6_QUISA|nr:Disease resistance protein [Quillaja saponaria]